MMECCQDKVIANSTPNPLVSDRSFNPFDGMNAVANLGLCLNMRCLRENQKKYDLVVSQKFTINTVKQLVMLLCKCSACVM